MNLASILGRDSRPPGRPKVRRGSVDHAKRVAAQALIDSGFPPSIVADAIDKSERTVRRWIESAGSN